MPRKRSRRTASPFTLGLDAWLVGAEAACVIAQRSAMLALGGADAQREAQRMVAEKAEAALELGLALASGGLGSKPETIARRTVAHYGKRVRANRKRLARPAS